jgi:threonine synthase
MGLESLWLKREDLNPTGSHKSRGAAYQLSWARSEGFGLVAISSSGNAAVAAAAYAALAGIRLAAFVAPDTTPVKLAAMARLGARVFVTADAITMADEVARSAGVPNLRPSTHHTAVSAYETLGWELAEEAPAAEAVFLFVASATTLVGLGRAKERAGNVVGRDWPAELHAVQGTGATPIARLFDRRSDSSPPGELGLLGARKTRRVGEAVRAIASSGGSGWIVTDSEAGAARAALARHGVDTSLEGAAALAAATRAASERGLRRVGVVLTGHASQAADFARVPDGSVHAVTSADQALSALAWTPV